MDKIGGVKQPLPISQPKDYPVGKWIAGGNPNDWGLPITAWNWIIDVESYRWNVGTSVKIIKAYSTNANEYQRIITAQGDTGWKQII